MTPERAAPGRPVGPSQRERGRWLAVIGGSLGVFALAVLVAPLVPFSPYAAYAIGFGAVCAITIASGATAPRVGPPALGVVAAIAVAVGALAVAGVPASPRAVVIAASAAVLVLLTIGGTLAGAVIGWRIAHPGHLIVVAIASSLADVWSVLSPGGPSATVIQDAPTLSAIAIGFPMLGTLAIEPLLGVGDVVFVALYLAAARKHGLGVGKTCAALALAFAVTGAAVMGLERALPALPFLGAAMLIAHPAARLPPLGERRTAAIGLGVLVLLGAVLVLSR